MRAKVPNILTATRLALLPATLFLLATNRWWGNVSSCALFILASVTDYWDGYLARRWGVVSTFGKFFDPLADKLLVISSLIMLEHLGRVSPWIVILAVGRELFVTGLRAFAMAEGVFIASSQGGKWKTALQMIAVSFLMISESFYLALSKFLGIHVELPRMLEIEFIGSVFLVASVGLSLWSALVYYLKFSQKSKVQVRKEKS